MKIRLDFVTNSSSSSYICEICGRDESGWDLCLSEAEMCECENGHVFCDDHIIQTDEDSENDDRYCAPIETCPICQFAALTDTDALHYLLKKNGVTIKDLLEEIKNTNKTYEEFKKGLK